MPLLLLLIGCASRPPARSEADATFAGKRYLFHYKSGLKVEVHYASDNELTWKALTGPSAGTSGTERIHTVKLAPGIYFISWVESNSTTVSNVVDLTKMKVAAFVTVQSATGRQAFTDEGTIHEIESM